MFCDLAWGLALGSSNSCLRKVLEIWNLKALYFILVQQVFCWLPGPGDTEMKKRWHPQETLELNYLVNFYPKSLKSGDNWQSPRRLIGVILLFDVFLLLLSLSQWMRASNASDFCCLKMTQFQVFRAGSQLRACAAGDVIRALLCTIPQVTGVICSQLEHLERGTKIRNLCF